MASTNYPRVLSMYDLIVVERFSLNKHHKVKKSYNLYIYNILDGERSPIICDVLDSQLTVCVSRNKNGMAFLSDLWDAFEEFIEALIHTYAYARDIYPRETFAYVRSYDMAVPHSNHPGVQQWATEAARDAVAVIRTTKDKKRLCLVTTDGFVPYERLVLDISHLPRPGNDFDTIDLEIDELKSQYRSCIVSTMTRATNSISTDEDRSMTLLFEGDPPEDSDSWIQGQSMPVRPSLYPVRFVNAGIFSMTVFRQDYRRPHLSTENESK